MTSSKYYMYSVIKKIINTLLNINTSDLYADFYLDLHTYMYM